MFEKLCMSMFHVAFVATHSYRPRDRKRALSGFTLIELLVVISIIAVLVAMLIPAIGMIRFSANGMVCLNREKQTAVGIFTYANDNENEMPYVKLSVWDYYQGKQLNEMTGMSCSTSVNGMIFPYVESMRIALCPSNKGRHPVTDPLWGAHKLPCPDPDNCQGRSNSYGAWMGNDDNPANTPNTNVMDSTHGCTLSQYITRMKNSYLGAYGSDQINRYSGRRKSGAIPSNWVWAEVWGSALITEMWAGQHKNGTRHGSTLVNIDGAGVFRTFLNSEINVPPYRQIGRYEQE